MGLYKTVYYLVLARIEVFDRQCTILYQKGHMFVADTINEEFACSSMGLSTSTRSISGQKIFNLYCFNLEYVKPYPGFVGPV